MDLLNSNVVKDSLIYEKDKKTVNYNEGIDFINNQQKKSKDFKTITNRLFQILFFWDKSV